MLIYFDTESKQAVVRNLIDALAEGGYLVIGPTEGIYTMLDPLTRSSPGCTSEPHERVHTQGGRAGCNGPGLAALRSGESRCRASTWPS